MIRLYDKYRPCNLAEIVGQDKAVAQVRSIITRGGFGGQAVWLSGASGTGKTTLARIIADTVADRFCTTEYDAADQVGADEVRSIGDEMQYHAMGKGGRAWIINEAHGLRAPIVRQFLGILERLPAHCVILFTTTREGEEKLFDGLDDASPLLSRCIRLNLTNQGLAKVFAARAHEIADREGLNGSPVESYIKLAQKHRNNFRAMLQDIAQGAMVAA